MEFFTDKYILGIYGFFCVIAICSFFLMKYDRKKKGKESEEFLLWMAQLKTDCSQESVDQFLYFIKSYQGGFYKKEKGIMSQEYTLKEKRELEFLFYQIIVPCNQINVLTKEELRNWLCLEKGMTCLLQPPHYDIKEDLEKII